MIVDLWLVVSKLSKPGDLYSMSRRWLWSLAALLTVSYSTAKSNIGIVMMICRSDWQRLSFSSFQIIWSKVLSIPICPVFLKISINLTDNLERIRKSVSFVWVWKNRCHLRPARVSVDDQDKCFVRPSSINRRIGVNSCQRPCLGEQNCSVND